jgi:glycosyltransferase involved in cell wall biosynthesis
VVVPPRYEKALAAGIKTLLTAHPEDRRRLGSSARARIEENYRLAEIVGQYVALYEGLMREKRGG